VTYVTEDIQALVGSVGPKQTAPTPLDADMLRRFVQGVMEPDPAHWDEEAAARYGDGPLPAPPLFPGHAFRRAPGSEDPLDRLAGEPDWDGAGGGGGFGGLPSIDLPLKRILNGGTEAEFFELARVGDQISSQAEYVEITEREGRSGPMVIVKVRTTYTNQDDHVLARVTNSLIRR
jgi:acyl dehydratase